MDPENQDRKKKHDNESAADLERVTGISMFFVMLVWFDSIVA